MPTSIAIFFVPFAYWEALRGLRVQKKSRPGFIQRRQCSARDETVL